MEVKVSFRQIRDKFVELCTISIEKTETVSYRKRGCLDGLDICKRMESFHDLELEVKCRMPEYEDLKRGEDIEAYWKFRMASAQIEWMYAVFAAGNGSSASARARRFYDRIIKILEDREIQGMFEDL